MKDFSFWSDQPVLAHRREDSGDRDSRLGIDKAPARRIGNGRRSRSDDLLAFHHKL